MVPWKRRDHPTCLFITGCGGNQERTWDSQHFRIPSKAFLETWHFCRTLLRSWIGRTQNLGSAGRTGVGLLHSPERKTYAVLVTFQKTEREFSPSTMYADYPISRELLHWESPSNTTQASETGQNLIRCHERNYTILIFARSVKRVDGRTAPFTFLGPASLVSFQQERPIQMVWRLSHPLPAAM